MGGQLLPPGGQPLTARLEAAPVNLQGVVVSASREQERRTQEPVAISSAFSSR